MNVTLPALSLAAAYEAEQTGEPYPAFEDILNVEKDVSLRSVWLRKFNNTLEALDLSIMEWNLYRSALLFSWPEYILEDLHDLREDAGLLVNAWRILKGVPESDEYTVSELVSACEERQKYDTGIPLGNVLAYWQDATLFRDVDGLPLLRLFLDFGEYEIMHMMQLIGIYEDMVKPEYRLTVQQKNPDPKSPYQDFYAIGYKDDARPDLVSTVVSEVLDYLNIDVCTWLSLCKFYPFSAKAVFFLLSAQEEGTPLLDDYINDPKVRAEAERNRADTSTEWLLKNPGKIKP